MLKYLFRVVSSLFLAFFVAQPAFAQESVLFQVYYGGYANECSWEVVNKLDGSVVLSGGAGLVDNTFSYNGNVSLYPGEYVFKAFDSAADGWTFSNGWYLISPSVGTSSGQVFFPNGAYQETEFTVLSSSSTELGMLSWLSPNSSATLSSSETVSVQIKNYGTNAVSGFVISYSINGGSTYVSESYNSSLNSGDVLNYTFNQTANLSSPIVYQCIAKVSVTGDLVAQNDTVYNEIISISSISSFPWSENFSTWPPQNWTMDGDNSWASYANTSAYCNFFYWQSGNAELISPALNLYSPATLSFKWSSGYSYQAPSDEFKVLISDDNGTSWDLVWSQAGINLFSNDGAIDVSPGTFVQETIDLSAYDNEVVNIKFEGISGYGYNLYLDDVNVSLNPVNDLTILDWIYPSENECGLTNAENITVQIKNVGAATISNYTVAYSIDGGANFISENGTTAISPGDTLEFTFSASTDFSSIGTYSCAASVSASGDLNISNNLIENIELNHLNIINTFPYSEDFENGNSDWALGSNKFGDVSLNYYNSNYSLKLEGGSAIIWDSNNINKPWAGTSSSTTATQAWNENYLFQSFAQSCLVDASSLNTIELLFDLKQFYRTGPKFSWFRVLVNDVVIASDQGLTNIHPQTSYNDPFTTHRYDLSAYAGTQFKITFQSSNKFNSGQYAPGNVSYVDNIVIQELDPPDAALIDMLSPVSGCALGSTEPIEVQIQNLGGSSISNFNVSYSLDGGTFIQNTVSTVIEAGNSLTYTFPQTIDLSVLGSYNIIVAVSLSGDVNNFNDTLIIDVTHSAPTAVSISGLNPFYCLYDSPITLTGNPAGGIFSGDGVIGNILDPTLAGLGPHNITYSYFDPLTGCSNVATQSLTISGTEVNFSGLYNGPSLVPVLVQVYYNSNLPQEHSWEIVDNNGTVYLSSPSGLSTFGYSYNGTIALPFGDYKFIAHDVYGDGWNNSWFEITPDFGTGTGFSNYVVPLGQQPQNSQETSFTVGGTIDFCLSDPAVTLSGTPVGGTFSGPGIINGNIFDPSVAGVGSHAITYTASGGGCIGNQTQYVFVEASPTVELGPDQFVCEGTSVLLDAGIANSYGWSTGATTSTINVSQTGNYAVTVTSLSGCESTDNVNITINPLPVVDLGPDQNNCEGDVISLDAGIADSYLWSNGATTASIDVTSNGTYTVTVSILSCEASDEINIAFHSVSVNLGADIQICDGQSAIIDAGSGSFYQYNWLSGQQTQTIEVNTSGTYLVTVTNQYGCSDTDEIDLIVNSLPVVDLGPDINIDNNVIFLDAGIGLSSYLWSTGSLDPILPIDGSSLAPGIYTYWVEVTNSNGCSSSDTIIITKEQSQSVQSIVLVQNWSLISTYIDPFEPNLVDVFSEVVSNVNLVKDADGAVYWPAFFLNTIYNMTIGEGYQVYMAATDTLEVVGMQIVPELTPITISSGWSILGYLRTSPSPIVGLLSSIVNDIQLVKNGDGAVYWPAFLLDGIQNMLPGSGYQILTTNTNVFTYPSNSTKSTVKWSQIKKPVYFVEPENTGHNMTLAIPKTVVEGIINPNDEIAVFSLDGKLLGSTVYLGKNSVITIWGDNPYSHFVEGIQEGESFILKKWNNISDEITDLKVQYFTSGNEVYYANTYAVVGKITSAEKETISISNYPNPFHQIATIEFYLPESSEIRILLYNLVGEYIQEIGSGNYSEGIHRIEFDGGNLQAGIYYYMLETPNRQISKKLCIEK